MKHRNYIRYYRVFKDDTTVTEISINNFLRIRLIPKNNNYPEFQLSAHGHLYYGYISKAKAMEMAKAGVFQHISLLLALGNEGKQGLLQYRFNHFQDLTVNLVDANIKNIDLEKLGTNVLINPTHDFNN